MDLDDQEPLDELSDETKMLAALEDIGDIDDVSLNL